MPTELTEQNLGEPPASGTGKYAVHAAGFLRNWSVKIHCAPSRRKTQHQERNAYLIRIALFSIFRRSAGLPAALTSYVNSPAVSKKVSLSEQYRSYYAVQLAA